MKKKKLSRTEAYLSILKQIRMKPAPKSRLVMAYLTTDHLRKICEVLNAATITRPTAHI
jgi:hypothetical protein